MAFGADTAIELSAIAGAETFGAQSFSLLKADQHQDMNGGFVFSIGALMEHLLERNAPLGLLYINSEENICIC